MPNRVKVKRLSGGLTKPSGQQEAWQRMQEKRFRAEKIQRDKRTKKG
jgi:hypothetical protein